MKKQSQAFLKICKKLNIENPESIPQIMSVEAAYKALGRKRIVVNVKGMVKKHQPFFLGAYDLFTVIEAINMDVNAGDIWNPNFHTGETHYEPRFWIEADAKRPSGFALADTYYDYWCAYTTAGSRLCFRSYSHWLFAATVFKGLFASYFLIPNKYALQKK